MLDYNNISIYLKRLIVAAATMVAGVFTVLAADKEEAQLAREYVDRAEGYISSNAWDAAKRVIDEGLEMAPDDPDLRFLNGRYYYEAEGDLQQSRYNLVKAIQESDHHYKARRLLVDVEEDSKHFSSAICYINELLEYEPYDRTLWRRKITLYNKIGHEEEADQALRRLARIYPNDSIIKRDLGMRNRLNWEQDLPNKSLRDRVGELELYIDVDPDIEYYVELVDTYYKLGDFDRAIGTALRGLETYRNNDRLVNLAASIMAEKGLYSQALALLKRTGRTGPLYNNLLQEAVADARLRDPYDVSGRLYDTTGDRDALIYLLNTSITRGYYSDAHQWLQEAYKRHLMDTTQLLMKEYALEKRFGTEHTMLSVLQRLADRDLLDEEHRDDYAGIMLRIANIDIGNSEWASADLHLRRAINNLSPATEEWPAAVARRITVLGRMQRLEEARQLYDSANNVVREYIEGLRESEEGLPPGFSMDYSQRFTMAYEEVAASGIKMLIDEERYEEALAEAEALLNFVPNSEAALRAAINMAQTLKKKELFQRYAARGFRSYPETPYFIVKYAISLQQQGKMDEALALLRPDVTADSYVNEQLIAAYAGITEEYANELLKEKKPELALESLDAALEYDPENKELLYLKGLAYEQMKRPDLAYQYLRKNYDPSNAEQEEWEQHMRYLRYSGYRNRVDASYSAAFYDAHSDELSTIAHLYSLASVSYSRMTTLNTYTGQISYKGVDGYRTGQTYESGGIGLEFLAQWDHIFTNRWSGMVNASYGTQFFNKFGANIQANYEADHDWTFSLKLGYRRTAPTYLYMAGSDDSQVEYKKYNLIILTPMAAKSFERIYTSLGLDLSFLNKGLYYNLAWKGKLFINEDNISSVGLMAGFGTFPELTFFDQSALKDLSHINGMVGADFTYLITHNFFLGVTGTWNTLYNPVRLPDGTIVSSSRNIYTILFSLHLEF
ncbi:MAG: tetratricopeptide repeat protein [Muribaculaceae bacterium]|nr:tetratricopeptide repeat protein [Muribaculaceae bacterium]